MGWVEWCCNEECCNEGTELNTDDDDADVADESVVGVGVSGVVEGDKEVGKEVPATVPALP